MIKARCILIQRVLQISTNDSNLQRRGQTLVTISIFLLGLLIISIPITLSRPDPIPSIIASIMGFITVIGTLVLAKIGRVALASWILIVLALLTVSIPLFVRREVSPTIFYLLIPLIVAGVVLRPWENWIVLAATVSIAVISIGLATPDSRTSAYGSVVVSTSLSLIMVLGLISLLGASVTQRAFEENVQARREAEQLAHKFEDLSARLEQEVSARTSELQQALTSVEARDAEKQALLDQVMLQGAQIREMSVPVLPVDQRTLVMPLVGTLDSERLLHLQEQALSTIERSKARLLLLDITGVPVVDSQVAQGLISTIQAVRLLGAEPVLIGVRPEVAQSLVALGIDLADLRTAGDLQGALHR
jgi:rsbT co-antagonist protein RsbR